MVDFSILAQVAQIQNKIISEVEKAKQDDGKVDTMEMIQIVSSIIPDLIIAFRPILK